MSEATPSRVERADDLGAWTIDLEPPGPAGTATLDLSSGLQILVDVAQPTRIGALLSTDASEDLLDTATREAAGSIFGAAALDALPGRRSIRRARRRPATSAEMGAIRVHIGQLALAEDVARNTTDEAVRTVAEADAALLAELLRDGSNVNVDRLTSTTTMARRLISEHQTIAARIGAGDRDKLADLMLGLAVFTTGEVATQLRSVSVELRRSGTHLQRSDGSWHPQSASIGQLEFGEPGNSSNAGHVRLDPRLFAPSLLDTSTRAQFNWNPLDGDLAVRCRLAHGAYLVALGAHWVRAYRPDSRTVIALAPLEPIPPVSGEQWAEARLHIGAQDPSWLAVDVTDEPEQRPPSRVRRTIEEATFIGGDAARLERVAAPAAIDAWETCANTWRAADDSDRAAIALARAANAARANGQEERAAALLIQIAALSVTWAADQLNPTTVPSTLVADVVARGTGESWQ